jgi:NAD(P)-dependent dehydrogenase (short-subunit alcohol dehydrogenase family)/uncharacterized OB-fold protein
VSARLAPPAVRSRAASAFSAAAAEGRLRLQQCRACEQVCYPAREACPRCWSAELAWADVSDGGTLLTESTLHSSFNPFFQARLPWRIGTVQLDAGPAVLTHLHGAVAECARVRVIARTDRSGQGVLMALPEQDEPNMMDDRQLRSLTCDPRGRAVLVTDVGNAIGRAVAQAIANAGSAVVYGGSGRNETGAGAVPLADVPGVEPVSLDPADERSIAALAEAIGAKVDIVVHTSSLVRPGTALVGSGVAAAHHEMEVNYFGLLRLARAFGPALRDREEHGSDSLRAWVNLLSVCALAGGFGYGTSAASQAAAWSLSQRLRADLAGSGVKVIDVLSGPLDDDWNAALPPPKVSASQIACAVVHALRQGIERMAVGPVAENRLKRFQEGPMGLEREGIPA